MEKDETTNPSLAATENPLAVPQPMTAVSTDRPSVPNASSGTVGTVTSGTSATAFPISAPSNPGQPPRMPSSSPLGSQGLGLASTRPSSFAGITRSNALPAAGMESKVEMPNAVGPVASPAVVADEIAATPTSAKKSAKTKAPMTPMQRLAENYAERASIIDDIRNKETRGEMLAGRRYLKAAETDPAKAADLRAMYDSASDRDKSAIEVACRRIPGFLETNG